MRSFGARTWDGSDYVESGSQRVRHGQRELEADKSWPPVSSRNCSTGIGSVRQSESSFLAIRGLRYHVRRWPRPGAPKLVVLHGWMDVSASFQFLVDELRGEWDVHAPDWRGYGLTEWARADCYWFPDYIADLHVILQEIHPDEPINLVGHSLGGNVAALYAGIRPARVAKLVNLEGFGLPQTRPEQAPGRYSLWLDELPERPPLPPYPNFAALEERPRGGDSTLPP